MNAPHEPLDSKESLKELKKALIVPIPDESVKCPVCDDEYVHFNRVFVLSGDDECLTTGLIEIKSTKKINLSSEVLKTANRLRDLSLAVEYYCESGHEWFDLWRNHKGMIYRNVHIIDRRTDFERGIESL